jgi:hypothetical protein
LLVPWSSGGLDDLERAAESAITNDEAAAVLIEDARAAVEALVDNTLAKPALLSEGEALEKWLADNASPHDTEGV